MGNITLGLQLMGIGMVTVFAILLIVIYGSRLIISIVNRIAPEEQKPPRAALAGAGAAGAADAQILGAAQAAGAQASGAVGTLTSGTAGALTSGAAQAVDPGTKAVLEAAVSQITAGRGHITSIKKL